MGFAGTGKIWMNGTLVDWKDATIHIASHVIHYGSGVFEGARCYATPKGSACFRLDAHMRRLQDSAKIYRMEYPLDLARLAGCGARDDPRQPDEGVLHPAARLPRLRHARRQPARLPGRRGDHGLGMGHLSRPGRARAGRRREGQHLVAHGAQHAACDGEEHRQLRELGADQDGGDRSTATPKGSRSTSTATSAKAAARTSSSCATARSTRRRSARRSCGGITRDSIITLARDLGYHRDRRRRCRANCSTSPTRCSSSARPPRSRRFARSTRSQSATGRRGPITEALQRAFFAVINGDVPDTHGWLTYVYPEEAALRKPREGNRPGTAR